MNMNMGDIFAIGIALLFLLPMILWMVTFAVTMLFEAYTSYKEKMFELEKKYENHHGKDMEQRR